MGDAKKQRTSSGTKIPDITSAIDPEAGLQDIILAIVDVGVDSEGNRTIRSLGKFEERVVGLEIFIKAGMRRGIAMVRGKVEIDYAHLEGIVFRSIGEPSDNLVAALSKLYRVPSPSPRMRGAVIFDGIVLDGDPQRIEQEHVLIKLFHDPWDREQEYSELFLHVDMPNEMIGIDEKDEDYRPTVIRSLTAR